MERRRGSSAPKICRLSPTTYRTRLLIVTCVHLHRFWSSKSVLVVIRMIGIRKCTERRRGAAVGIIHIVFFHVVDVSSHAHKERLRRWRQRGKTRTVKTKKLFPDLPHPPIRIRLTCRYKSIRSKFPTLEDASVSDEVVGRKKSKRCVRRSCCAEELVDETIEWGLNSDDGLLHKHCNFI